MAQALYAMTLPKMKAKSRRVQGSGFRVQVEFAGSVNFWMPKLNPEP
jgi:hypothetical protein